MSEIDPFLRAHFDDLQFVLYFGLLFVFGATEAMFGRRLLPQRRLGRWPTNFVLTALNIIALGIVPVSAIVVADWAAANGVGLFNLAEIEGAGMIAATLAGRSFVSYATHFAMHKVPIFWRVHSVHHTDKVLDVSTTVRFHPLEFVIQIPIVLGATVAFGFDPVTLIAYELIDVALTLFTHSNIDLPKRLDVALRAVIVTPAMHRVHHSSYQPETDSNYAATFAIWDHIFFTHQYRSPEQLNETELGLGEIADSDARSLWRALLHPLWHRRAVATTTEVKSDDE